MGPLVSPRTFGKMPSTMKPIHGRRAPAPHVLAALRAVQPRLGPPAVSAGRAPHVQAALQSVTQARPGTPVPGAPAPHVQAALRGSGGTAIRHVAQPALRRPGVVQRAEKDEDDWDTPYDPEDYASKPQLSVVYEEKTSTVTTTGGGPKVDTSNDPRFVDGLYSHRKGAGSPPDSNRHIPDVLYHVTHKDNLAGIQSAGLKVGYKNSTGGLNSQASTSDFQVRDAKLGLPVYLARSEREGISMIGKGKVSDYRVLRVQVPRAFRDRNLRSSMFVLYGKDESSDTIICFESIPVNHIEVRTATGHIPLASWTPSTLLFVPSETT